MFTRGMTVITGHFGSGKTEIATNGALEVARRGEQVTLVDLDVVKPYFRSRALRPELAGRGVRVVAPEGEKTPVDMPVVQPDVRGLLVKSGPKVIVDVGGDPVGALIFGSVSDAVPRDDFEHLVVLNFARPQTETIEQAVAMVRAIQSAARLPVTGLVANTHLLGETTPETVSEGLRLTAQTAKVLALPVAFVAVEERLVGAFPRDWAPCPVLPLRRLVFPPFERLDGQPDSLRGFAAPQARLRPRLRAAAPVPPVPAMRTLVHKGA